MTTQQIQVPDIGADEAEVIEWLVQVGDRIEIDDSLLVLESDKASMEVPSTLAGKVETLLVSIGDAVSEGVPIVVIRVDSAAEAVLPETGDSDGDIETAADQRDDQVGHEEQDSVVNEPSPKTAETAHQTLLVPDIGTDDGVEVIEISVSVGDQVSEGDTLIVLESDKASMEIPSEFSGEITALMVTVGDTLCQGDVIGELVAQAAHEAPVSSSVAAVSTDTSSSTPPKPAAAMPAAAPAESMAKKAPAVAPGTAIVSSQESAIANSIYAGPAVRKLAREFSIPLDQVQGSGPRSRILKEDLQAFVQHKLRSPQAAVTTGSGIPAVPAVDFSAFGSVRTEELSKIGKVTATNMQRSWLNVPHVTQFDDADITDLEAFRGALKEEATRRGTKLTPLPFLLKACAIALRENPKFNASLAPDGQSII
ncbi:MAG TPA: dihydrolipoamide acetyltransferase, partial [Halieaceae bacterium]|nr:dihydrolipoamide acetyltransferase [Halieaceae bacterium]